MLTILALAAAAMADPLAPAVTRVTTSFKCAGAERSITTVRTATRISVAAVSAGGRSLAAAQIANIRSGLAPLDRYEEVVPLCQDGPDRILIRGRSGDKKRNMMIFFGPNGATEVRQVG